MSDDRKYRQRGYQDEPRGPKGGPKGPKPPRPPQERAPGRVLQDERGPKTPNLMAAHDGRAADRHAGEYDLVRPD